MVSVGWFYFHFTFWQIMNNIYYIPLEFTHIHKYLKRNRLESWTLNLCTNGMRFKTYHCFAVDVFFSLLFSCISFTLNYIFGLLVYDFYIPNVHSFVLSPTCFPSRTFFSYFNRWEFFMQRCECVAKEFSWYLSFTVPLNRYTTMCKFEISVYLLNEYYTLYQ